MVTTEEHTFNPDAMESESGADADLGDYDFEVDKLEAEAAAAAAAEAEAEAEEDTSGDEPTAEDEPADEGEDKGEGEGEGEPEDIEPSEEDQLADPAENPMIPRERLNQANRKRQEEADRAEAATVRIRELESQIEASAQEVGITDIDPLVLKEAAEKVLDGDTDAFRNVLAEQMNKMQAANQDAQASLLEQATNNAVQVIEQQNRDIERQTAADEWVAVYPELNHESESVNTEALQEAIEISGMYEDRGYRPAAAMERAIRTIAANYDLKSSQTVSTIKTPAAKPAARKKVAAKEVNQPPAAGQGGADKTATPAHNAQEMSQEQWDALPESVRDEILTGTG